MAALEAATQLASVREPITLARPQTRAHWAAGSEAGHGDGILAAQLCVQSKREREEGRFFGERPIELVDFLELRQPRIPRDAIEFLEFADDKSGLNHGAENSTQAVCKADRAGCFQRGIRRGVAALALRVLDDRLFGGVGIASC